MGEIDKHINLNHMKAKMATTGGSPCSSTSALATAAESLEGSLEKEKEQEARAKCPGGNSDIVEYSMEREKTFVAVSRKRLRVVRELSVAPMMKWTNRHFVSDIKTTHHRSLNFGVDKQYQGRGCLLYLCLT